jgi:hypothetical protein
MKYNNSYIEEKKQGTNRLLFRSIMWHTKLKNIFTT